jgi:hypothetical protein
LIPKGPRIQTNGSFNGRSSVLPDSDWTVDSVLSIGHPASGHSEAQAMAVAMLELDNKIASRYGQDRSSLLAKKRQLIDRNGLPVSWMVETSK